MNAKVDNLDPVSGQIAVQIARNSLVAFLQEGGRYSPDRDDLPEPLINLGASFVTITNQGELRGCMGHTSAQYPLGEDIAKNAMAASRDFRFPPVRADELEDIRLEVTILTPLVKLGYDSLEELIHKLRPGIDGVMLTWRERRGLLLPQVWDRIPDPINFLEAITIKAGIPRQELRAKPPTIGVLIFQVQHFAEPGYREPGN